MKIFGNPKALDEPVIKVKDFNNFIEELKKEFFVFAWQKKYIEHKGYNYLLDKLDALLVKTEHDRNCSFKNYNVDEEVCDCKRNDEVKG